MDSCNDTLAGGLPHSDIHGSTPARGSPWLFAACHVLHRLLVPRHPPNALLILDTPDLSPKRAASPCTETILRLSCQGSLANGHETMHLHRSTVRRQPWKYLLRTQQDPLQSRSLVARAIRKIRSDKIVHNASEPSPSNRWGTTLANSHSRSDTRPNDGTSEQSSVSVSEQTEVRTPDRNLITDPMSHAPRDAPEPDSHFQRAARPPKRPHHGTA